MKTGATIYEASSHSGGICRSYKKGSFEFAVGGGHWLFGENKGLEFIKTLVPLTEHIRRAGIYYNTFFDYPIQTFSEQDSSAKKGSMKDTVHERFSKGTYNLFLDSFNEKYTFGLYDEIVDIDRYKTPEPKGQGFCAKFWNPVGGMNTLIDKMSEKCDIRFNHKVWAINTQEKVLIYLVPTKGDDWREFKEESVKYDRLISTLPLGRMLAICRQGDSENKLPFTSVWCLNIGAKPGRNFPSHHWLYIPFSKNNFYRVGIYTNVDPTMAPEGCVSLSVEMACDRGNWVEDPKRIQGVIEELQDWGWISEVITAEPTFIPTAYTWNYTTEEREKGIAWLKERDIISTGRYGSWKFQGITQSIQQGIEIE